MASAATAVAAVAARARREIYAHFESAGAFDPAAAVPYEPSSRIHERQFALLAGKDVVREARPGRYWLDQEMLRQELAAQARALKGVLAFFAAVCLVVAAVVAVAIMR